MLVDTCFSAVVSTCFTIASHFSFSLSTVCHVCFSSLQSSVTLSEHFFIISEKWASSDVRAVANGIMLWPSPAIIGRKEIFCQSLLHIEFFSVFLETAQRSLKSG